MTNNLIDIVPTVQSAALLKKNIRFKKKRNKEIEEMIGMGMQTMIGIELIGETANITNDF